MKIADKTFPPGQNVYILGILNITPDSFSDGGRHADHDAAVSRARDLAAAGADIIDVGGESTRPGSSPVAAGAEKQRTAPVIAAIAKHLRVPVSIDTAKAEVAEAALLAGAGLINDISALTFDGNMAALAAGAKVPVILMHMQGTPKTMQNNPSYRHAVSEVGDYLLARAAFAEKQGIAPENIILDPGIGFGKRLPDNLALMRGFARYIRGRYPVCIGHSRKRFIGDILGLESPGERLFGSLGAACAAAQSGAAFVRTHDVRETREALAVFMDINRG